MVHLARDLGDKGQEALALASFSDSITWSGDWEGGERAARDAVKAAGEEFDYARFLASAVLAYILVHFGSHAEAKPFLATAEKLEPRIADPFSMTYWYFVCSIMYIWQGRLDGASVSLERWCRDPSSNHPTGLLHRQTWNEAYAQGNKENYDKALALLDESSLKSQRSCTVHIRRALISNTLGWLAVELRDHRRASELNQKSIDEARSIEPACLEAERMARLNLGDNFLALGRLQEAEEQFLAVEKVVRNPPAKRKS